ncbi:MAG: RsmD family RNA methyltransferase [Rhodobacteraceae bacterium]|nr:RsmD family RNA methyltransferase [Paracoccaceae bacterium]
MRIVAGRLRGLRLAGLGRGDPAAQLRPTADRVRESLFNVLWSGFAQPAPGVPVLDLFAGTGALGLEALSRGAGFATFVESGRVALGLIRDNIARARAGECTRIVAHDAARIGPCPGAPAGLVFLDPPYGRGLGARALTAAAAGGWLAPGAVVVWEENAPQDPPEGFVLRDHREYGDTHVTLLTAPD